MFPPPPHGSGPDRESTAISRRAALKTTRATASLAAGATSSAGTTAPDSAGLRGSTRRFGMKKSINLWAFPYPGRMSMTECLRLAKAAGFDGIELNFDLENDLSPRSGPAIDPA